MTLDEYKKENEIFKRILNLVADICLEENTVFSELIYRRCVQALNHKNIQEFRDKADEKV